jgi:hypothetical protein
MLKILSMVNKTYELIESKVFDAGSGHKQE